ncbi:MAG: hydratase [Oscillospiraceae bacterium]
MIRLIDSGVTIHGGKPVIAGTYDSDAKEKTIAAKILASHNKSAADGQLHITFDGLISHDITYVGIIQTARASGLTRFPVPYVLTNCHNSLCAVGGTINEDDHVFGLSAAIKYGGDYVPANQAVIHQYAREMMTGCGKMILGSDSHTRYGAIGTMGIGEGGPELVKQLLQNTYDVAKPQVVLVWLTGEVPHGVGPHDVAIALCGATYKNGFVKNKVLEFAGPGVKHLPMDFRIGIDVMTTETACLSSIWETDEKVEEYLAIHGRPDAYRPLRVEEGAYYDSCIEIDLSKLEPMAALPFHPSEAVTLRELIAAPGDYLRKVEQRALEQFGGKAELHLTDKIVNGKLMVDQGVIAGCSGGMYDNIAEAASILNGYDVGCGDFSLSVYPPSIPVNLELIRNGVQQQLLEAGALFKPCFCGPCFGAGDVPANNALSIRHTTRNFPNREGSKPGNGQLAGVILMDARSIAATARNHGVLTSAADVSYDAPKPVARTFDADVYKKRVYFGCWKAPAGARAEVRPQYYRVAENPGALGESSHAGGLGPARPCDHDGRADSLGRNIVVPLEPPEARNLCPLPPGPRVCRPRKRDVCARACPRGRPCPAGAGRRSRKAWSSEGHSKNHAARLCDLCQQARRRLCARTGRVLPESARRLREYLL